MILETAAGERVLPSPLWAAGFSFSRSALLLDVPYDPFLPHLFFGEEISMAARLYTHGYDFFTPTRSVIYHLWSRAHRPTQSQDRVQVNDSTRSALAKQSLTRVQRLLGMTVDETTAAGIDDSIAVGARYGLGTSRSLQQFEAAIGVDFKTRQVKSLARSAILSLGPQGTGEGKI